ncbi:unnamed protein product [Adineta ricciae]|uniref:NAD(P)(+)--arginine ADP-ribosyltransferase n=1 Tax=Adineta ricciae TaxID=249248 RepID=A0A815RC15_ADIRI|nr:unnamed protein product [Adineta ricciae]CAF1474744.1 unnamed protein product [Adineta ricciae]
MACFDEIFDWTNPKIVPKRLGENVFLIWLDARINQDRNSYQRDLKKLRSEVNDLILFTDVEVCVKFIESISDERILIITSGSFGQTLVPRIHSLKQVNTIYIFCRNPSFHKQWTSTWMKIQGIYTQIELICQALKVAVKQSNEDLTSISFIQANSTDSNISDLNRLEPSFMYTRIFKKILLQMKHDNRKARHELIKICHKIYADNANQLAIVEEFGQDYHPQKAIWWYTRECFTYQILNRALRLLEGDIIVDMGFFIHDLHCQLAQVHREQLPHYQEKIFQLYRGQGLSTEDFAKMRQNRGGLISFNSFLSTSRTRTVSLQFAQQASKKNNMIGVLFVMNIDPKVKSTPFADIKDYSYFQAEAEVLFSMHSLFRIDRIQSFDKDEKLFQVDLIQTTDDDPELLALTKRLEKEIGQHSEWIQLGRLLIKIGQPKKAEELFLSLLEHPPNKHEEAEYFYQLGWIKDDQGEYSESIQYYQKSVFIREKICTPTDLSLASTYDNLGMVYNQINQISTALHYCEKALHIRQTVLPADATDLALSYNNVGFIYFTKADYNKALSYYNKGLIIYEKKLPDNHPQLAIIYNNIAEIYSKMNEQTKALLFYDKVLSIQKRALPVDHPDLARSYNNIGGVYCHLKDYDKALSYLEKAVIIYEKAHGGNHSDLATSYNNLGSLHMTLKNLSKALDYYNRALEIWKKSLPDHHSLLATCYNNLGTIYIKMKDYSQALVYFQKSLEIQENLFHADHPDLAVSYSNIAAVYGHTEEQSTALSYYYKAMKIWQEILPEDHPHLSMTYNNIGGAYLALKDYSQALEFFEKALDIFQRTLPSDHPNIKMTLQFIGVAKRKAAI